MPAAAHHSRGSFLNETIALEGEVVSFRCAHPHALFCVRVTEAGGKMTVWEVEAAATPTLTRSGWKADSLQPW